MNGLSLLAVQTIEKLIDDRFDSISLQFLGLIPKLSREKKIIFTTNKSSLTSLFLQALGTRDPTKPEEESLKVILRIANGYVDALKEKTKTNIIQNINAYVQNQSLQGETPNVDQIKGILGAGMDKAKEHFSLIASAETQKCVNTGTALQIRRIATDRGVVDPIVFFIGKMDEKTCKSCILLFFLPDLKTPRVWKLSELNGGYYKIGDQYPSVSGLHPHCRHYLTYLPETFGFSDSGYVTFKGLDWDEFKYQREKFGLPNIPVRVPRKRKLKKDECGTDCDHDCIEDLDLSKQ